MLSSESKKKMKRDEKKKIEMWVRHLNFISMTIIYLLHEVAVESKRFEVTYSRDSLLIKKSSSSLLECRLILDSSSASISLAGTSVPAAPTFEDDFPNVFGGNCVAKIIDNNKTTLIIAWKHDKYEGKDQNMTFSSSSARSTVSLRAKTRRSKSQQIFTRSLYEKVTSWLSFLVVEESLTCSYLIMTNFGSMIKCKQHVTFHRQLPLTDWTPTAFQRSLNTMSRSTHQQESIE